MNVEDNVFSKIVHVDVRLEKPKSIVTMQLMCGHRREMTFDTYKGAFRNRRMATCFSCTAKKEVKPCPHCGLVHSDAMPHTIEGLMTLVNNIASAEASRAKVRA